jgi:NosR/NirI family nitrous oxide reductase transcriptional regulator
MAPGRNVSGELLLLSTTAVMAVYTAGYLITEPAANRLAQVGSSSPVQAVTHGWRDGTYLGHGENRFGGVYVAVQIAGGRISQVWVTSVTTTFPPQVIAGLPGSVVERQSTSVDLVSGATGSSAAFIDAVQGALRQAQL